MKSPLAACLMLTTLCCAVVPVKTPPSPPSPTTIDAKTADMQRRDGFIPMYWDDKSGKLWLEITRWDAPFLYVSSLVAGVGSNDLGLDRGRLGGRHVVRFIRSGKKVLLIEDNLAFRATSESPSELRAVDEAFAKSVLWGFTAEVVQGDRVLIDATSFALADANQLASTLSRRGQGRYAPSADRSAIVEDHSRAFVNNTEIEAHLTLTTSDQPGAWIRSVTPSPRSVTVRQRHSFIALPGPGFTPRPFHPRSGMFQISYVDYAAPLAAPMKKQFVLRHRLIKKDPNAAISDPVEPLVYYVDRGAPEPIRTALMEGASWWASAFEAAGFSNAFRVELLPEGADPMDIRYHVIQWVHRSTRGWSYGDEIIDPRTGEIIKAHISLGSLRVRQDILLGEGLIAPHGPGDEALKKVHEMALSRLRQLAAHEVGHTLGFAHNFAASPSDRASVMDYPHPLVRLVDGQVDLTGAYAAGIGAWDKVAARYGYAEVKDPSELTAILDDADKRGLQYISDADARPPGGAHPTAHLWDNGLDPVAELDRILEVRAHVLERLGAKSLPAGRPAALLEEVLVPMYLLHRYQVEAVAKLVGGVDYRYASRDDPPPKPVSKPQQERALRALLRTLQKDILEVPARLAGLIPPRPPGFYGGNRERLPRHTGVVFDPLAAASAAAGHTVRLILHPQRSARLLQQSRLTDTLRALVGAVFTSKDDHVSRAVEAVTVTELLRLTTAATSSPGVRAAGHTTLKDLEARFRGRRPTSGAARAHARFQLARLNQFFEDPKTGLVAHAPEDASWLAHRLRPSWRSTMIAS